MALDLAKQEAMRTLADIGCARVCFVGCLCAFATSDLTADVLFVFLGVALVVGFGAVAASCFAPDVLWSRMGSIVAGILLVAGYSAFLVLWLLGLPCWVFASIAGLLSSVLNCRREGASLPDLGQVDLPARMRVSFGFYKISFSLTLCIYPCSDVCREQTESQATPYIGIN